MLETRYWAAPLAQGRRGINFLFNSASRSRIWAHAWVITWSISGGITSSLGLYKPHIMWINVKLEPFKIPILRYFLGPTKLPHLTPSATLRCLPSLFSPEPLVLSVSKIRTPSTWPKKRALRTRIAWRHLGQFSLSMCRWPLETPDPLHSVANYEPHLSQM